jgi:hypothetical protein
LTHDSLSVAASGVGTTAVIRLLAAGQDLAALGFCHVKTSEAGSATLHLESPDVRFALRADA